MAQGYALVAAKMYNETLDKKIYYFQDELRPFKAQMEELRLEARDPEGYVARESR
jgi:hypothetical protein